MDRVLEQGARTGERPRRRAMWTSYMPCVGRYWSSRNTTFITRPDARVRDQLRAVASSAGDERSTSPTAFTSTSASSTGVHQLRGAGQVGRQRLLAEHREPGVDDPADRRPRCAAVQVQTNTASTASITVSTSSTRLPALVGAELLRTIPVGVVHRHDLVRLGRPDRSCIAW